jgi:hypothetical protein
MRVAGGSFIQDLFPLAKGMEMGWLGMIPRTFAL